MALAVSRPGGRPQLWVRSLDSPIAQPLAGTDGASCPFWSPDSRFLGFFAERKLRKAEASGGAVQTLCDADGRGASWSRSGVIVFAPGPFTGLSQVSASGGNPIPVTTPEKEGVTHRLPHFLPDGRRLLFFSGSRVDDKNNGIFSLDLQSKKLELVARENSEGYFVEPGYLVFVRQGNLMAQPMDTRGLRPNGEAVRIAEEIRFNPGRWTGDFSFSETGCLVFQAGSFVAKSQLTWFDREGKRLETVGEPARFFTGVSLSPDGQRAMATIRAASGRDDLWAYDLVRGVGSRFTFGLGWVGGPIWSPDGRQVVYGNGNAELILRPADGTSAPRTLVSGGPFSNRLATSWSPDGSAIAFQSFSGKTGFDVWILPLVGGREPYLFSTTPANKELGVFSPDGRWLAYVSNESGKPQLYVARFPGAGAKQQVSTDGAVSGFWSGDGREVVYVTPENKLVAVGIDARGDGLVIGQSRLLFGGQTVPSEPALSRDGRRFLMNVPVGDDASSALTLVTNWNAALKK